MADERAVDRIVDLETTTSPLATDYVPVDSTNQGTRRLSFPNLADKTLDELNTKDFNISTVGNRPIPAHIRVLNERISEIITPSGQPSLSELVDIRTNFLGETFGSAGDAVRTSDMIASRFSELQFTKRSQWAGNVEDSINYFATASIDVSKYKGGRLTITMNDHYPAEDYPEVPVYIYASDTRTPDATAVALSMATFNGTVKTIKSYVSNYRNLLTLDIPDDFEYQYVMVVYLPISDIVTPVPSDIILPDFSCYGVLSGASYTFSDPSQDGNIVIS